MDFRLLGPIEGFIGDNAVEFTSGRQRKLMALLLFYRGQVVPLDRIIDALWDGEPPVTAKGQVQTCVFGLRRQFRELGTGDLIRTAPIGYAIHVPDGALDIVNFERLAGDGAVCAAEGRLEEAVLSLRAALALWRGQAAANVDGRLLQSMAGRLNEDRIRVVEECVDLELSLGRHHRLVGELSELVAAYPLREWLRAQHMLALYRSGRQAEALESFQEIRQVLMDDLGLQPGEELSAMQRAILAQDTAIGLPREVTHRAASHASPYMGVPRQLPATTADFTGRQRLLAEITRKLSDPPPQAAGRCLPVACLKGEGGAGKTALAVHAAHGVRHLYPDGQLFMQMQDADGRPADPMELLAQLISSLGRSLNSLPDTLPERISVYRSWIGERRLLIILDDVTSVAQAMALMPGNPDCGIIITSRNPLASLPGARHFMVGNLEESACAELMGKIIGTARTAAEPDAVRQLVRFCDRLPLAVRIVAAKLSSRPHWSIAQMVHRMRDEPRRLDELAIDGIGIRATLADSYSGLGPRPSQLFVRLSLLGTADFGAWVSAPLLDLDPDQAEDALDALVSAHLLEVRVEEDGTSRFRMHDLVRIYALERFAVEEGAAERTITLQRLLSSWLFLTADAHRRVHGGDYGLHGHADTWSLPDHVRDRLLASPMDWFRQERAGLVLAVTLAAQIGLDEVCWDLAVTMATLFEADYLIEDWRKTHETALEITRRVGNARGEAALLCSLGCLALIERPRDAPQYLELALRIFEKLGDVHGRARALSGLAYCDRMSGHSEQALIRYSQSLADCRAVGEDIGVVEVLGNMAQIQMDRENYGDAAQLLDLAFAQDGALKARRTVAQLQYRIAELRMRTDDFFGAEQALGSVLEIVKAEGDLLGEAHALAGLGAVRIRQRRYDLAEANLSSALELSRHMDCNLVRGRVLLPLAELSLAKADMERANALVTEGLVSFSETGWAPVMRARFLEIKARVEDEAGNPRTADAARREALELAGDADAALSRTLAEAIAVSGGTGRGGAGERLTPGRAVRGRGRGDGGLGEGDACHLGALPGRFRRKPLRSSRKEAR
ncbi:MAG TPA: BTAD domain-containing putative transcriptional regulator [Streptosporangiaceae bacterium]|nr:BTAD domain-containing putative transcriptional regulator [Streptosporangiaceae bacterium]